MLNEKQAIKFWNNIARGEIIGYIPDSQQYQGDYLTKPTYLSTICDQFELPTLIVPYTSHFGAEYGCAPTSHKPNKDECYRVANFLRNLADSIESAGE